MLCKPRKPVPPLEHVNRKLKAEIVSRDKKIRAQANIIFHLEDKLFVQLDELIALLAENAKLRAENGNKGSHPVEAQTHIRNTAD